AGSMMSPRNAASARAGSSCLADSAVLIGRSSVCRGRRWGRSARASAASRPRFSRPRLQRVDDARTDRLVELGIGALGQSREHLVVADRKDCLDDLPIAEMFFDSGKSCVAAADVLRAFLYESHERFLFLVEARRGQV